MKGAGIVSSANQRFPDRKPASPGSPSELVAANGNKAGAVKQLKGFDGSVKEMLR